jgi:hypothetical protein
MLQGKGLPGCTTLAAVVGALVLMAGCGGSDTSHEDLAVPTKDFEGTNTAAYFAFADAICGEEWAKAAPHMGKYFLEGWDSAEKSAATLVNQWVVPSLEKEINGIRILNLPARARPSGDALFEILEKLIAAAKADPKGFVLTREPVIKAEEEARSEGFRVCGGI